MIPPIASSFAVASTGVMEWPLSARAMAAERPAIPVPTMTI